jgi:hypothetical protein
MSQIAIKTPYSDKIQATSEQISQFQRQKGPTEAHLPNTPTPQNDRQTLTHELAIEQELPPLHSAYLTSFDTITNPVTPHPIHFNPTHTTEKSTTDDSTKHTAEAWWSGKLTTKRLEQFASTGCTAIQRTGATRPTLW